MSLTRIATRIAICQALRGKTEVGANVLDSQIGLVETDAAGKVTSVGRKPFISVYADSAKARSEAGIRSLLLNGLTEINFDIGISTQHVEVDPVTDESVILPGLPAIDDAMEFYLDLVARQVLDALNDPADPWADIYRSFIGGKIVSADRACATSGVAGVRVALHQIRLQVDLLPDPVRGRPLAPEGPMARFFALVGGLDDDVTRVKAARMLAQIEGDATPLDIAIRRYGFTAAEAKALLISPIDGVPEGATVGEVVTTIEAGP